MKVAAVSLMCQDPRVFAAMEMAGTPCPYEGKIGAEAADAWAVNPQERPDYDEWKDKLEDRQQRIVDIANAEKSEFVRACKRTKHPEGTRLRGKDVGGINKSGDTCRKEWQALQNG